MDSGKTAKGEHRQIIDLLNKILKLEYSLIIHYPRIASYVQDEETKEMVLKLGEYSTRHADITAKTIQELEGEPVWDFEPFPELENLTSIMHNQLDKEKLALRLHAQAANLAPNPSLRDTFTQLSNEESGHIELVKTILSRLDG